jgi:hypothetical protein
MMERTLADPAHRGQLVIGDFLSRSVYETSFG